MEIRSIPLSQIQVNPEDNSRQTLGPAHDLYVRELMADIRKRGLINPILVTPNDKDAKVPFVLVAGFSRYTALTELAKKQPKKYGQVDAQVKTYETWAEAYVENIAENTKRRDLSTFDVAISCKRLKEVYKLKADDIGAAIGRNKKMVWKYLAALKDLDPRLLKLWQEGKITFRLLQDRCMPLKTHGEQWEAYLKATGQKPTTEDDSKDPNKKDPLKKDINPRASKGQLEQALKNAKALLKETKTGNTKIMLAATVTTLEWALNTHNDEPNILSIGTAMVYNPDMAKITDDGK